MTKDVKDLPENLDELAKTASFKQIKSANTAEELETKLNESGVEYLTSDLKDALVWRFMDAKGLEFTDIVDGTTDEPTEDSNAAEADPTTDGPAPTEPPKTKPPVKDETEAPKVPEPRPELPKATKPTAPQIDIIRVKNTGHANVLEPASGTLLKKGETTTITVNPRVGRERIIRNINQMNITRGKTLEVL